MRGTLAKKLRKFAKEDSVEGTPWTEYHTVRRSHRRGALDSVELEPSCGKSYYKLLKNIWKKFK